MQDQGAETKEVGRGAANCKQLRKRPRLRGQSPLPVGASGCSKG